MGGKTFSQLCLVCLSGVRIHKIHKSWGCEYYQYTTLYVMFLYKEGAPSRVIVEKSNLLSISVFRNKSNVHNLTACVHWESQNFPHFGLSRDFPLREYRCFNSVTAHRRHTWLDWHLRNTPMCSACQIHIFLFLFSVMVWLPLFSFLVNMQFNK